MKSIRAACAGLLAVFLSAAPCFADDQVARPSAREVVIVMRVHLDPPPDSQYLAKLAELEKFVGKKNLGNDHALALNCLPKNQTFLMQAEHPISGHLGEMAMTKVDIPSARTLILHWVRVYLMHVDKWFVDLPVEQEFEIPAGAQYIYLGTIRYHRVDEFFTIDKATRIDEFDAAQEIVRKQFGDTARLYRASFRDIEVPKKK